VSRNVTLPLNGTYLRRDGTSITVTGLTPQTSYIFIITGFAQNKRSNVVEITVDTSEWKKSIPSCILSNIALIKAILGFANFFGNKVRNVKGAPAFNTQLVVLLVHIIARARTGTCMWITNLYNNLCAVTAPYV